MITARAGARVLGRLRRTAILAAVVAGVAAALATLRALTLALNLTPSMPIGLYRLSAVDRAPHAGDIVEMCPGPALAAFAAGRGYLPPGPCPHRTAPLLKLVAATDGDVVDVSDARILVNGRPLPHSETRARDSAGRPLPHAPHGIRRLHAGEVWLWTPCARGWDSRYYGALPAANLRAYARPFIVDPFRRPC